MKRFIIFATVCLAAIISLQITEITAYAHLPVIPFEDISFERLTRDYDGEYGEDAYIEIWKKEKTEKDILIKKGQNITITSLGSEDYGILAIENGVTATVKGDIFIERGGVLEINNGTLIIDGGSLTNCGTVLIGRNGSLKILSGTFNSTAVGNMRNDGKIICTNSCESLNNHFKTIKKHDGNFTLSNFSLLIESDGDSANVTINYCIDDIMTDFKYKFQVGTSAKSTKITRMNYSEETVYDKATRSKLLKRATAFEKENYKKLSEINDDNCYWKNYGYVYSYKNKDLTFNAEWVTVDTSDYKNVTMNKQDFSAKAENFPDSALNKHGFSGQA